MIRGSTYGRIGVLGNTINKETEVPVRQMTNGNFKSIRNT